MSRQSRTSPLGGPGVNLSGAWRARISGPDLAKTFAEIDCDDSSWANVSVPNHWRSESAFADNDGPVLYRRHFVHAPDGSEPDRTGVDDTGHGDRRRWFLEL